MWIPRSSSVGDLMASPEKKALPEGAMTYLEKELSKKILNWEDDFDFKTLQKGRQVEDLSIELYNDVHFTNYIKNTQRKTDTFLTGECDIFDEKKGLVIDIKSAFSKKTFPVNLKLNGRKGYEWQLRAYMYLWDCDKAELAYCLVDTPFELIGNENEDWHVVGHINPAIRVSTIAIQRSIEKENQMLARIVMAQDWMNEQLDKRGLLGASA